MWAYREYVAATSQEDAVVAPVCENCGQMGSYFKLPGSAHLSFLLDVVRQIANAGQGAEVVVSTKLWVSMNRLIPEALAARPDVSLTLCYLYEDRYYTVTVPAGYDAGSLLDENGWAGFRWLDSVLGGREITEEDFISSMEEAHGISD